MESNLFGIDSIKLWRPDTEKVYIFLFISIGIIYVTKINI